MQNKIAVLGAGTMGPGIAVSYLLGGYEVFLYSRRESTLEQARKIIGESLSLFVEEAMISSSQAEDAGKRLQLTTDLARAVADAWYIAETIVENPEAKTALYQQLDALLPEDVIIASNTSYLDIFSLMPKARLPYTVISHWYAPAHILPLVEVVKGDDTLPSVMERTTELHKKCGKQPVQMQKFIPGFIVNRMQSAMSREVSYLIENGYCTAQQLDLAVKTSLMPRGLLLGLVQRLDFNGLDMVAHSMRNKSYSPAPVTPQPKYILDPVERGEYGIKSGKGLYDYTHMPMEEVLRIRDKQLLRSVRLGEEFLHQPLHRE